MLAPRFHGWARAALVISCLGPPIDHAYADAVTHRLVLTTQSGRGDCGQGRCSPYCSFKATLKNVSRSNSPTLEVAIWYETVANDAHKAAVSLQFPPLKAGGSAKTADEARGYACDKAVVTRVDVSCPEASDGKCRSFFNVAFPALAHPKIAGHNIEGR